MLDYTLQVRINKTLILKRGRKRTIGSVNKMNLANILNCRFRSSEFIETTHKSLKTFCRPTLAFIFRCVWKLRMNLLCWNVMWILFFSGGAREKERDWDGMSAVSKSGVCCCKVIKCWRSEWNIFTLSPFNHIAQVLLLHTTTTSVKFYIFSHRVVTSFYSSHFACYPTLSSIYLLKYKLSNNV